MPLSGGAADKIGNRYEIKWVVRQIIRLLREEIKDITLEPVGEDGDFVEFLIRKDSGKEEVHQVKRQRSSKGYWSISALNDSKILTGISTHTAKQNRSYVFVSTEGVQGLKELAERAKDPDNFSDFEKHHLTGDLPKHFTAYVSYINTDRKDAWQSLRKSDFRSQDEKTLTEDINSYLDVLTTGSSPQSYSSLVSFILENTYKNLIAKDVWDHLQKENISPSDLSRDNNLAVKLQEQLEKYFESQSFDIAGKIIRRTDVDLLETAFTDKEKKIKIGFLTGSAGSGKSGVAKQFILKIQEKTLPILPLRLDRLEPTKRIEIIGKQVFGREKSPVAILAGIANGRECYLVVEQLDAVSLISGRSPEFFDAIDALVKEARIHDNMKILMVCRSFDLDNDYRFRQLRDDQKKSSITTHVNNLDEESIKEILVNLNIKIENLAPKQIQLLSLPLHLFLLSKVYDSLNPKPLTFVTGSELFDEFWIYAKSKIEPLLSSPNNFAQILDFLCNEMSTHSVLSLPAGMTRRWDSDINILIAGNIIIKQGGRISFFHEGFFDYVFARFFIEDGKNLPDYLTAETEQGLFLRGQVRQVLTYLRGNQPESYVEQLRSLLDSSLIRFHIKSLAINILGLSSNPTKEEWEILKDCLNSDQNGFILAAHAALHSNPEWFKFLFDHQVLSNWLTENEEKRDFVLNWAGSITTRYPKEVTNLLRSKIGESIKLDNRIVDIIASTSVKILHKDLESLFYEIVNSAERGWDFRIESYERFLDRISYNDQTAACRVVGEYLKLLLLTPEEIHPFLEQNRELEIRDHNILKIATEKSVDFVKELYEPLLLNMERFPLSQDQIPHKEKIPYTPFSSRNFFGLSSLFISFIRALKETVKNCPELYYKVVEKYSESDTQWAHLVLLQVLTVTDDPESAANYLLNHWGKFGIWYDRYGRWDAYCLLKLLGKTIQGEQVLQFESILMNFYEMWNYCDFWPAEKKEQAQWHRRDFGAMQHLLLSSFPEDKLSHAGKRRHCELKRKAECLGWKRERPLYTSGGTVESPLDLSITKKMGDEQWISAVKKYDSDKDREYLENRVIGGAGEFSRMLEQGVKDNPIRFAKLFLKFPNEINHHYYDAIAMGLGNGGLPGELLKQVIFKLQKQGGKEVNRWISNAIAAHSTMLLSEDLLVVIHDLALSPPLPEEKLWQEKSTYGQSYYSGDPHFNGINTTRGNAATAIARMISNNKHYWDRFLPVLEKLVLDPSLSVRSCVASACTQGLFYDRSKAVSLFITLCDTDDELLGTNTISEFLRYTLNSEYNLVQPIIERMVNSKIDQVRKAGARHGTLAALDIKTAHSLLQKIVTGDEVLKKEAARVLGVNICDAPYRKICMENLIPMFDDPSEEVRSKSNSWYWVKNLDDILNSVSPVIEAFIESRAFREDPAFFFGKLGDLNNIPPKILFKAIKEIVKTLNPSSNRIFVMGGNVLTMLIRIYRQAEDDKELRIQCLDVFDEVLSTNMFGYINILESMER